jgi:hypothetical protein
MKKPVLAALGLAAAAVTLFPAVSEAQSPSRVRAGTLNCAVSPGVGLLIGSRKQLDCVYTSSRRGYRERYTGAVTRLGIDVGFTAGGRLAWAVFAPSRGPAALAGTYVGAGAEATAGVGAQANVLVGGSDRSVALQPLSVGVQTGVDLALAVSSLELQPAGPMGGGRRHRR